MHVGYTTHPSWLIQTSTLPASHWPDAQPLLRLARTLPLTWKKEPWLTGYLSPPWRGSLGWPPLPTPSFHFTPKQVGVVGYPRARMLLAQS